MLYFEKSMLWNADTVVSDTHTYLIRCPSFQPEHPKFPEGLHSNVCPEKKQEKQSEQIYFTLFVQLQRVGGRCWLDAVDAYHC